MSLANGMILDSIASIAHLTFKTHLWLPLSIALARFSRTYQIFKIKHYINVIS